MLVKGWKLLYKIFVKEIQVIPLKDIKPSGTLHLCDKNCYNSIYPLKFSNNSSL
jgi:hypothetical protein